jgi:hypothetical protein
MSEPANRARLTALSMAHGAALAKLLRAHGRKLHADNLDAALLESFEIVSREVGAARLAEAVRWVAEQAGADDEVIAPAATRH